jgi:hypothetical protein
MGSEPAFDLLAFSDRLGEPAGEALASLPGAAHGAAADAPMTPDQAEHLNHLLRRSGRPGAPTELTFAEAKARIAELIHDLG